MLRGLRTALAKIAEKLAVARCRHCGAVVPPDQMGRAVAIVEDWDDVLTPEHPDPARCEACGGLWPADQPGRPSIHVMHLTCIKPWQYPQDHPEFRPAGQ